VAQDPGVHRAPVELKPAGGLRYGSHGHHHRRDRGGIIGSALGHLIAGLLGFAAYGIVARLIVQVGGAALLIALLRKMGVYR
jgi:hypothetical protein